MFAKTTHKGGEMTYLRRADLTNNIRLEIALKAFQAKGVYGAITQISQEYNCCRLFVYQQLGILLWLFESCYTNFDTPNSSISGDNWERLVLLLRLENTASVKSISRTLKYLGVKNNSVGYISQKLQEWGQVLESSLKVTSSHRLIANADEIYASGKPILVSIDPVSMAILKIELATDCTADTWKKHWEGLEGDVFQLEGMVSDRGKGLTSGAKAIDLVWYPDHFHEFRELTKIIEVTLFNQAKRAIKAFDKMKSSRNREREEEYIDIYDAHDYLSRIILQSLPFLDAHGNFRDPGWIRGEVEAALELLIELDHKEVKALAKRLLKRLPETLNYLNVVDSIGHEIKTVCPSKEILSFFCQLWNHTRGVVNKRGRLRIFHRQERETWDQLLRMELGRAFDKIRDFIFQKLDSVPRTSSLIESVNSLIRPYLNNCKGKITQESLNLVMFRHNHHPFADGRRKGKSPIELLTGKPLSESWVELLIKKLS